MKKIEEFRTHAEECRQLARRGDQHTREQLLKMAETWDMLAYERERRKAKSGAADEKQTV